MFVSCVIAVERKQSQISHFIERTAAYIIIIVKKVLYCGVFVCGAREHVVTSIEERMSVFSSFE